MVQKYTANKIRHDFLITEFSFFVQIILEQLIKLEFFNFTISLKNFVKF